MSIRTSRAQLDEQINKINSEISGCLNNFLGLPNSESTRLAINQSLQNMGATDIRVDSKNDQIEVEFNFRVDMISQYIRVHNDIDTTQSIDLVYSKSDKIDKEQETVINSNQFLKFKFILGEK